MAGRGAGAAVGRHQDGVAPCQRQGKARPGDALQVDAHVNTLVHRTGLLGQRCGWLLGVDGRPLFPERRAYTVKYELSPEEAGLYSAVTEYVRTEMNRVQRFAEQDGKKRNNVGFALQILQRRLASSPAAIYQSLRRRRERLEAELAEARLARKGGQAGFGAVTVSDEMLRNIDEYGQEEVDDLEELISTVATTAETVEQLEIEVQTLKGLEIMALDVLRSGKDTKWTQLDRILDDELMIDGDGNRRKLIIFTEPKDTLHYLLDKVRARLGRPDAVEVIHGGVTREERRKVVERFMQDRDMLILIVNDAAGEGVNLQRGHLMVNYDLPWNPNKIEQRFGRIHRIGQTEVCHLWNLVAADPREGEVNARLLEKLEAAREALGGRVYDVLGELFEGTALRDLLFEAIQYGEQEEVKARLFQAVDGAVDQQHLLRLHERRALTNDTMPAARVQGLRLEMERAEAQRLQPHHIQSFFVEAFKHLGGQIRRREEGRWEITHVPLSIRERDRQTGMGAPIQKRYERICFEKAKINQQPIAAFICPGHPLLEAVISVIRERHDHLMKRGAILIDDTDPGEDISALFLLEHSVQDGRPTATGKPHVVSERLQFAAIDQAGRAMIPSSSARSSRPPSETRRTKMRRTASDIGLLLSVHCCGGADHLGLDRGQPFGGGALADAQRAGQHQCRGHVPAQHRQPPGPRDRAQLAAEAQRQIPDHQPLAGLRRVEPGGAVGTGGGAVGAVVGAPAEVPAGEGAEAFFSSSSARARAT